MSSNLRMHRWVAIGGIWLMSVWCASASDPVTDLLSTASTWTEATRRQHLDELAQLVEPGDKNAWRAVRAVLCDANRDRGLRHELLLVAIDKADPEIAREIVQLTIGWLDDIRPIGRVGRSTLLPAEQTFVVVVVRQLCQEWGRWLAKDPEALRLVERSLTHPYPEYRLRGVASRALVALDATPAQKRKIAEAAILASPEVCPRPELVALLDESSRVRFREAVRVGFSEGRVQTCALSTLAHVGDPDILPDLQAAMTRLADRAPFLEMCIFEIQVQQSPDTLLELLEVSDDARWSVLRPWALTRAVERGIEKPKIREALLRYAAGLLDRNDRVRINFGLTHLKADGIRLEVLSENDLPQVPAPPSAGCGGE